MHKRASKKREVQRSVCSSSMCDSRLDHPCSQEPRNIDERSTQDASVASAQYLCYFMHRLLDFRQPEVKSLADMTGCCTDADSDSFGFEEPYGGCKLSPFWYLRLPSESIATSILQRSLLVKVQLVPCCILVTLMSLHGFTHSVVLAEFH